MRYFKSWPIFDPLPVGWVIDKNTGSPLAGHSFATNGKSILNGGMRALVPFLVKMPDVAAPQAVPTEVEPVERQARRPMDHDARLALNNLARAKFMAQLLKDLCVDLHVCQIEGWDTAEYVAELHTLIDSVHESIKPAQGRLFHGVAA